MTTDDTYPNAGRDSGYSDEAGRPVGENIINRVTELLLPGQTKLIQLADQMDGMTKIQHQRFEYVLNQLAAYQEKEDFRHGVYDESERATLAALTSVAQRLDEITGYVQQSVTIAREALAVAKAGATRLEKLERDTKTLKQGQRRISGEVLELRERLDRKRKELDDIHAWQERMDARAAAYPEEEIAELVDYVRRKKAEEHGNG